MKLWCLTNAIKGNIKTDMFLHKSAVKEINKMRVLAKKVGRTSILTVSAYENQNKIVKNVAEFVEALPNPALSLPCYNSDGPCSPDST